MRPDKTLPEAGRNVAGGQGSPCPLTATLSPDLRALGRLRVGERAP